MALMNKIFIIGLFFYALSMQAFECVAEKNPSVFFKSPKNNYISESSEVKIVFGIKNFNILPAGVVGCNSGHHHLVINADLPNLERPIPTTENYVHFGKGQTETTIYLKPGKHTLQLLLGDYAHIPHKKPIFSEKITIEVISSE
jgi:hypothetical protein